MKYMGDYPSKRFRQTTDLTDAIFEPALLHVSKPSDSYSYAQNAIAAFAIAMETHALVLIFYLFVS